MKDLINNLYGICDSREEADLAVFIVSNLKDSLKFVSTDKLKGINLFGDKEKFFEGNEDGVGLILHKSLKEFWNLWENFSFAEKSIYLKNNGVSRLSFDVSKQTADFCFYVRKNGKMFRTYLEYNGPHHKKEDVKARDVVKDFILSKTDHLFYKIDSKTCSSPEGFVETKILSEI